MSQSAMNGCLVSADSLDSSITVAIIERVAAKEGVDPVELPPLGEQMDCDALETIVATADRGTDLEVAFSYEGYAVTVAADNTITVQ